MSEYHSHLGRRAELKEEFLRQDIMAKSHFESLRLALDPLSPMAEMDPLKIFSLAAALTESVERLKEIRRNIEAINGLIGK